MAKRRVQRSRFRILGELLEHLDNQGSYQKRIANEVNIVGALFKELTEDFISRGLMEWVEPPKTYRRKLKMTEKGKVWLKHWKFLNKMWKPNVRLRT